MCAVILLHPLLRTIKRHNSTCVAPQRSSTLVIRRVGGARGLIIPSWKREPSVIVFTRSTLHMSQNLFFYPQGPTWWPPLPRRLTPFWEKRGKHSSLSAISSSLARSGTSVGVLLRLEVLQATSEECDSSSALGVSASLLSVLQATCERMFIRLLCPLPLLFQPHRSPGPWCPQCLPTDPAAVVPAPILGAPSSLTRKRR